MENWLHTVPQFAGVVFYAGLAAITAVAAAAQPAAVTAYHYDNLRTGWNSHETTLTAAKFPSDFGVLHTIALDDQIDAQPLVVPGLKIGGVTHDVVFIATESNTIYAIDGSTGEILLKKTFGAPVPMPLGCTNNGPNVGIDSTPVIDLAGQTLYFIAYVNGTPPTYQLHALSLSNLEDKPNSPITIAATHIATEGSTLTFNATYQRQRPALLLNAFNGTNYVYAGFGSFCDFEGSKSRGWVLGWNANTLVPLTWNKLGNKLATSPTNWFLSSIWMSGYGIAASGDNLYFVTGNSSRYTYDGFNAIQESVVSVSGDLTYLLAVFTPSNHVDLDIYDADLGAGGVMLLPKVSDVFQTIAMVAGKTGRWYLVNPLWNKIYDTQLLSGCWCGPSFFTGSDGIPRIVTSQGSWVKTWQVSVSPAPHLNFEAYSTIATGQDPGFFTSISSNGTTDGSAIIWAVSRPTDTDPALVRLYAFDGKASGGVLRTLYSAPAGTWPSEDSNANIVPVVANGKVYVASYKTLTIFGAGGATAGFVPNAVVKTALQSRPLAAPGGSHQISGTVLAIDQSIVTLKSRSGKSEKVDAALASQNEKVGVPLSVGIPLTVQGSLIEGNGALQATSIMRAKGTTGELWPPNY